MPPLPKDMSYKKLYEPEQNIWFLNWVLKQHGCYSYLNQIILSMPFTINRIYNTNNQLFLLKIKKNGYKHSFEKNWYTNGQLCCILYFKNNKKHGLYQGWHLNGRFYWISYFKNDKRHGLEKQWNNNGQLIYEFNWHKGKLHGRSKQWKMNGQLSILYWKNGCRVAK